MAINIGANFDYKGRQPNFARDSFATKTAMKAFAESNIDDGHLSYCAEDGNLYMFKFTNAVDSTTGKWRKFETGSSITVDTKLSDTSTNPVQNKVINEALLNKANSSSLNNYVTTSAHSESIQTIGSDINTIRTDISNIKKSISTVYKYKGSKDNFSELSTITKEAGDVWNIVNADTKNNIKAGDNVAWNGKTWDNLSGTIDLSGKQDSLKLYKEASGKATITTTASDEGALTINTYGTKVTCGMANFDITTKDGYDLVVNGTKIKTTLNNKVDKVSGKGLSTNDYTTDEKNKLAGIASGATKDTTMTGASASTNGTGGLVPAPKKGQETYFFKGDGTWAKPTDTVYSLPAATTSVRGGIKVGSNLSISNDVLSLNPTISSEGLMLNATKNPLNIASNTADINLNSVKTDINIVAKNRVYIKSEESSEESFKVDTYGTTINCGMGNFIVNTPSSSDLILNGTRIGRKLTDLSNDKYGDDTLATAPNQVVIASTTGENGEYPLTLRTIEAADLPTMSAATSSTGGKAGIVPAPAAGKQTSFLRGDGTWSTLSVPQATSTTLGGIKLGNLLSTDSNGKTYVQTTDKVEDGGMTPVTGKAVYDKLKDYLKFSDVKTPISFDEYDSTDAASVGFVCQAVKFLYEYYASIAQFVTSQPKQVVLTQAAYDALTTKDDNTIYYING